MQVKLDSISCLLPKLQHFMEHNKENLQAKLFQIIRKVLPKISVYISTSISLSTCCGNLLLEVIQNV